MYLFFVCILEDDPEYLIAGTHAYPSGPGEYDALILTKPHFADVSKPIH